MSTAELDFGEVWEDPGFVRQLTVHNRGKQMVRVVNMHGGCECTSVEPRAFTVPPGGSQRVAVKIDLTHRYPYQFGVDRRQLALTVHAAFEGRGIAAEAWTVRGVVKSRVSVDGRELTFADLCGQGESVTRSMKATAHVPLAKLEATAPSDKATVVVVPAPKRPGGYDVRVTPNPDLPLGPFQFEVALTATTPDGAKHRCVAFRVSGEMGSPVRVVPNPVLLGNIRSVLLLKPSSQSACLRPAGRLIESKPNCKSTTAARPALDDRRHSPSPESISKPGDAPVRYASSVASPTANSKPFLPPFGGMGVPRRGGEPGDDSRVAYNCNAPGTCGPRFDSGTAAAGPKGRSDPSRLDSAAGTITECAVFALGRDRASKRRRSAARFESRCHPGTAWPQAEVPEREPSDRHF